MKANGWRKIGPDPAIRAWAEAALPLAKAAVAASDEVLRCGGTWAVGLDLLPNAPDGSIAGCAFPWAALGLTPEPVHRAQISTVYPGYPQADPAESPAALAFRRDRAAAHLDGLLAIGPDKRRMIKEPHAWILGLPLGQVQDAPLVVWQGSHRIIRQAFQAALAPHDPQTWGEVDLTAAYHAARAEVFRTCPRLELPVVAGEATLLHRLTIHGVAPWATSSQSPRMICYLRPLLPNVQQWVAPDQAWVLPNRPPRRLVN